METAANWKPTPPGLLKGPDGFQFQLTSDGHERGLGVAGFLISQVQAKSRF